MLAKLRRTVTAPQPPNAPDAPPRPASAFSDTVLARPPRVASAVSVVTTIEPAGAAVPWSDKIRALPLPIQGIWVGLTCIVLLIGSAAALRSLFTSTAGPAPAPSSTATVAATVPSAPPTAVTTAAPTPTAPPTATLSIGGPSPPVGGAFGALTIRDRLATHVRLKRVGPFIDDMNRLIEIEPSAIDRNDVRKMVADVAVQAMTASPASGMSPDAERLFTFLMSGAGPAGPDILFDLVTTRGGSRAASYADELLRRPEVVAKGTPALKIANEMRLTATCQDRTKLFDRVKSEGDRRVLQFLFQMARCGKGPTDCCMGNETSYRDAVRVITAKK